MCSYFLVLAALAAAFWTVCSLFIKRAEQPPNKALQETPKPLIYVGETYLEIIVKLKFKEVPVSLFCYCWSSWCVSATKSHYVFAAQ